MISNQDILLRLLLAALIGGIIGIEREASNRPAGLRTHILVSVGSALIMLISLYGMPERADPSRIASNVVTGVGFLGAGTILRNGNTIKGLTTAASLWVCAGIGLAVGSGYYFGGIVTALIVLISLVVLSKVEKNYLRGANKIIRITAKDRAGLIGEVGTLFGSFGISIRNITIDDLKIDDEETGYIDVKFYIKKPMGIINEELYESLLNVEAVKSVDLEDGKMQNWKNKKGGI